VLSVAVDTRRRDAYARAFVAGLRGVGLDVRRGAAPWRLWRGRPDVVHGLDGVLPPWRRSPGVVTVWRDRWEPTRADLVVCPSTWLADEVSRLEGVDRAGVRVVPFAPAPQSDAGEAAPTPAGPYVLALADVGIVPPEGHELVVDRAPGAALLGRAGVLVHPGRRDGAGLVVLEAMSRGVPVVAARAGALPEIGGDAALYVDTAEELPAAIARALAEHDRLAAAGRARAALYTWEATAQAMVLVYRELLGGPLA
jgi:glycosyltransferase involved in cell wall biosynthesis